MRALRACLLLALLLVGCGSEPTEETDPLLGTWQLVSIDDRSLPTVTSSYTRTADGVQTSARFEVLSARLTLDPTGWQDERSARSTLNGVVTLQTTRDVGTWERAGSEILLYDARGYAEGAASVVGDALSVLRYSLLDRGRYFLYRK
jgi:hypothetical protein